MYVPSDPHDAYRYGVKQATEPIEVFNVADTYVNDTLEARRKKLLTKKVTKWVNLYLFGGQIRTAESRLAEYDSEEAAKEVVKGYTGAWKYLKTVSVEIDEPL